MVLNSNCSQVGGCGAGSPQETWLRQDLWPPIPRPAPWPTGTIPASASATTATTRARRRCGRRCMTRARRSSSPAMTTTTSAGRRRPRRHPGRGARHPRVRGRHRRQEPLRAGQPTGQCRGVQRRHLRHLAADAYTPPATTGSSSPKPARPLPIPAVPPATERMGQRVRHCCLSPLSRIMGKLLFLSGAYILRARIADGLCRTVLIRTVAGVGLGSNRARRRRRGAPRSLLLHPTPITRKRIIAPRVG